MRKERTYEFRKNLNRVHQQDRRDFSVTAADNELIVENGWKILIDAAASGMVETAAKDLQDYFFDSMNVSVMLCRAEDIAKHAGKSNAIVLGTVRELPDLAGKLPEVKSYCLQVNDNNILICGSNDRGLAQGSYYLEDLMNLKEAPLLKKGEIVRKALFSPRMTHSGWGMDEFPDAYLNAVAHAGMDAILIFAKGPDLTTTGCLDFNDLIDRAAKYGIDLYLYSYLKSLRHPAEKDAAEYYESTYGRIFAACPRAKGVILVGESCEFPSRDTVNTTGEPCNAPNEGIRPLKPSPGWWPCYDYPEWLEMIKATVRKYNPEAEIVFWTYNWGCTPEKDRLALIDSLPEDITLQVTFEMFEQIRADGIVKPVMDYSITFPGPGKYFASEAAAAKKKNIRLYAMANTGGMTWDFGTVPYIPVPQQWTKRHDAILKAHDDWGLCGLMESHHYGFTPSVIGELGKWRYWSPAPDAAEILDRIAIRDFGKAAAPHIVKAWDLWSEAMNFVPVANEDQCGPLRIGASYPFIFHPDITRTFRSQTINIPSAEHAHFGSAIVKTFYHPFENEQQSPGAVRFPVEIKALKKAADIWQHGIDELEKALEMAPDKKKLKAGKMLGLGKFILAALITALHCKQWWLLNQKLLLESDAETASALVDAIETLLKAEIANAEQIIPWVEADSRLGWEPSMEYMTDRKHLEWKIRHARQVLEYELNAYRTMLKLHSLSC
ncbi:MAG: hypothetical protein PHV59_09945 [Victivallales bacterium]|nr:hypothetical protein [Victivallales bacterium]